MAHFYGSIHGDRGEATRCGTVRSGLVARANGWHVGATVELRQKPDGADVVLVYATTGSSGAGMRRLIAEYTRADLDAGKFQPK